MVFRVVIPKKKASDVVDWAQGEYKFQMHPFQDDYINEEMNTVQFLFNDKLVAQVVSLKFGDGTYREF